MDTQKNPLANVDRFDLEQAIMDCDRITDDLNLLAEKIIDADDFDVDELANVLTGLSHMHRLRCERVDAIFGRLIETRAIT